MMRDGRSLPRVSANTPRTTQRKSVSVASQRLGSSTANPPPRTPAHQRIHNRATNLHSLGEGKPWECERHRRLKPWIYDLPPARSYGATRRTNKHFTLKEPSSSEIDWQSV